MIRYGVWNGIKYDNTLGDDKAPEGLDLKALKNFNPGNPIDVVIGNAGFSGVRRFRQSGGSPAWLLRKSFRGFLRPMHAMPHRLTPH